MLKKSAVAALIFTVAFTTACAYNMPVKRPAISAAPQRYTQINKGGMDNAKIKNMSALAEQAYIYASAKNWKNASRCAASLKASLSGANTSMIIPNAYNGISVAPYTNMYNASYAPSGTANYATSGNTAAIQTTFSQLQAAINSKNSFAAKKCANQLYKQICANLPAGNVNTASNINNIKYLCREISLNCENGNKAAAKNNCASLVKSWKMAKPSVNSVSPAECAKTQAMIDSLNRSCGSGNLNKANSTCGQLENQSNVNQSVVFSRMM